MLRVLGWVLTGIRNLSLTSCEFFEMCINFGAVKVVHSALDKTTQFGYPSPYYIGDKKCRDRVLIIDGYLYSRAYGRLHSVKSPNASQQAEPHLQQLLYSLHPNSTWVYVQLSYTNS